MISLKSKQDALGQDINPGDVCVRIMHTKNKFKNSIEFIIYKESSWGGSKSKGEFGRFITPGGVRSLKYTSVIFVFDPLSERRAKTDSVTAITKQFYEGKRQ